MTPREDYESTDLEGAARFERDRAIDAGEADPPDRSEYEDPPDTCQECGAVIEGADDDCWYCGAEL